MRSNIDNIIKLLHHLKQDNARNNTPFSQNIVDRVNIVAATKINLHDAKS